MEKESMKSGASKISRNNNGRFEGGAQFGGNNFVKWDVLPSGK